MKCEAQKNSAPAPIAPTRARGHHDSMQRFRADLLPVPHGGHYVVVPPAVVAAEGIKHHSRVRGTCNGAPYRSATPIYSGLYHLGVPKATLEAAGAAPGTKVTVTIELDPEPLDRKSTRLNSSHSSISYAVFCLKKKTRA